MPEGDTIFRTAQTLHRALAGKVVTRFETVLPKLERVTIKGRTIERVVAAGKHLMIEFEGGVHLHTHMRMNGSWHIYRVGQRWRRPRSDMRLVIETADYVAVGFNVPVADFDAVPEIGPDLLSADFDPAEALRRVKQQGEEEIANVLLNQRVMAGVGNIWKSEALFRSGVDPFKRVRDLDDATLARIIANARKLLKASAASRVERMVYSRGGQPCRRCGTRVASRAQGPDVRLTYWCPKCQPTSASSSSP
ncbi:MAG: DNA-formamidopyrimidine glycosylase family protein [Acidobacteriota bacterium]